MKTDELVAMLATQITPVHRQAALRRFALATLAGVLLGALWMAVEFGVRADLAQAAQGAAFWGKLLLAGSVACAGFVLVQRLARPGVPARLGWWGVAVPLLVVWALGAVALWSAPAEQRLPLLLGETWRSCALSIAMLSLPAFVAALWALRSMAPTQPAVAGAAAGVLAGGVGALVYALHCPEVAAPFLAVWYVAGMAVPVLAGAWLGPRVARW